LEDKPRYFKMCNRGHEPVSYFAEDCPVCEIVELVYPIIEISFDLRTSQGDEENEPLP